MPVLLPSFRRQQLLLEFAAIKSRCPEGLYLTPEAGNPAIWSGVFFVREGPYSSAILRFDLSFPATYPESGPILNFSTEIFHPLLVPLTTYTFAAGAIDPNTTLSASDTERLTPGSFNLRYGFPSWYAQSQKDGKSTRSASIASIDHVEEQKHNLQNVLQYVKKSFEDADYLDSLPAQAAVNTNAWHAWRFHRGLPKMASRSMSPSSMDSSRTPLSPGRAPADWNWDGVWESRVRNGIEDSMSDALLFGSKNNRTANPTSGSIKFAKFDDEQVKDVQAAIMKAFGMDPT